MVGHEERMRKKNMKHGASVCRLNVISMWKDACNPCNQAKYKMSEKKLFAILEIKKKKLSLVCMCNDSNNLTCTLKSSVLILCVHHDVHVISVASQRI